MLEILSLSSASATTCFHEEARSYQPKDIALRSAVTLPLPPKKAVTRFGYFVQNHTITLIVWPKFDFQLLLLLGTFFNVLYWFGLKKHN